MRSPIFSLAVVCLVSIAGLNHQPLMAQVPGERPPRDVARRLEPMVQEMKNALAAEDASAVRTVSDNAIRELGPWAGNPETATKYYPPIDRTPFDPSKTKAWWLKEVERGQRGLPWLKNPDGDPRTMAAGLREAAVPLDALARTALLFPELREDLTKQVRTGADWLLQRQHSSGVFPFPIGPALNPREKVGHIVARAIRERPEIVVNDWIPGDDGDGGLQFDTGLCGRALVSAWELTREERYLNAAQKAGDWAMTRPCVSNWNYNAFSVGLLARLAEVSEGDRKATYIKAAVKKAEVGVLPGQMDTGRWFDAHNACAVYHNILLRDLLELFHVLPADHPFRPALQDAVTRGLNQASDETLAHGYTGTWTDNFARGLQWVGENQSWRDAMNVNLNAAGKNGAPTPGPSALAVLEGVHPQP